MKILIHGRKNGYTILYPKPTPTEFYSFASDIQSINANNYDIYYNKCFYTLAFVDEGCVFTKYILGEDVERRQLGEIGISIFIPNTHKLSGADVKTLLDELINIYRSKYIPYNRIEEPKTGFIWDEFTSLANEYDSKLLPPSNNNEYVIAGIQDPAFHYYKTDSELIEHFENPFQEEYMDYKQILFIDNNFQGAADPLNVLKNSGVPVNPDLKNEYFYLNYINIKGVKITTKGKLRSDKRGENKIRKNWPIEIYYLKDERCYMPINVNGIISDKSSKIYDYIEVIGNQISLKLGAFNNPIKKKEPITFYIKDQNGKDVGAAEIQIENQNWLKINGNVYQHSFFGEEIINKCEISVKNESENLFLNRYAIIPFNQNGSVVLTLQKYKEVKIIAIDRENGYSISNFEYWCNDGKGYRKNDIKLIFVNDEIYKPWSIEVKKNEGREIYSGIINDYYPTTGENPLYVKCQKSLSSSYNKYKIDSGKHGKKAVNCPDFATSIIGAGLGSEYIMADKGYIFKGWKFENDILVAQYEKKKTFFNKTKTFLKSPSGITTSIVSAIFLPIIIWALYHYFGIAQPLNEGSLTSKQITDYVQSDSLFLNTLNDYKVKWKNQEQNFITRTEVGLFGGLVEVDSGKWKSDWKPVDESIDLAIKKRELLRALNFTELKNQRYTGAQLFFEDAINTIDTTKYIEVRQKLGDVSALTLTRIGEKIIEILKPKVAVMEETHQETEKIEIKPIEKKETFKKNEPTQETNPTLPDNTSQIIHYIKGGDLKKETLKMYLKNAGDNTTLKASINLSLKLWSLDGTKNKSYSSYLGELKKDTNLKDSQLTIFIDAMCIKVKPKYVKELPESDQSKSLTHIKAKCNE